MKFVLILTIVIGTDEPHGGIPHAWALDTGLTGPECTALLEKVTPAYDLIGNALLSCEEDRAEF